MMMTNTSRLTRCLVKNMPFGRANPAAIWEMSDDAASINAASLRALRRLDTAIKPVS
jgi:hypothetical protein